MMVEEITIKMIHFYDGLHHDINHFLKVWSYARTIGVKENLDSQTLQILEISAVLHDIACPLCREKYGSAKAELQEKEGIPLGDDFLNEFQLSKEMKDRILYLIGHHHTLDTIDGLDYQILVEADFLVNAEEGNKSKEDILWFMQHYFKTKTGIELLTSIYQL